MKNYQLRFIEYASNFARSTETHIWLGGSFLHCNFTEYSDIDITMATSSVQTVVSFINGYKQPVFLSYTDNPPGIIIAIYEDGVAIDLEISESVTVSQSGYFHREDIKSTGYIPDTDIFRKIIPVQSLPFRISRLFHRSLIKFLSGKTESGISVANEIADFMGKPHITSVQQYIHSFPALLSEFNIQFSLPCSYLNLLIRLTENLNTHQKNKSDL